MKFHSPNAEMWPIFLVCLLTIILNSSLKAAPFDVTTILKLEESSPGVYESFGTLTVVARGDARGLPLRKGQTLINATFAGQPCCTTWTHEGWTKLDSASAEATQPPLDPQETPTEGENISNDQQDASDKLAIISNHPQEEYVADSNHTWRGKFPIDARVRIAFRVATSPNATLGFYLCGSNGSDAENKECVAFLLFGHNTSSSFLRYEALQLSNNEKGSERDTPFGKFKSRVLHKNYSTDPRWDIGITYNFLMERASNGAFELRLDGGDQEQRQLMIVNGEPSMTEFAALVLLGEPGAFLDVKADTTWYGILRPGGDIRIRCTPPNSGYAYLGIFICNDRFQGRCVGEVLSGHVDGQVRFVVGKYGPDESSDSLFWVAGNEERHYPISEIARSEYVRARWDPVRSYTFSVSRSLDGTVRVRLDGGEEGRDQRWSVPKEYIHLFIANYHHEGRVYVQASLGRCGGSSTCSAPAPLWVLGAESAELRSPSIPAKATSGRRLCLAIVARLCVECSIAVDVHKTGGTEKMHMDKIVVDQTRDAAEGMQWLNRRIVRAITRNIKNQAVNIVLNATQPAGVQYPVIVQWATVCHPEGEEDVFTVSESASLKVVSSSLGFDVMIPSSAALSTQPNPVCLNDGQLDLLTSTCKCVPGYAGKVCDQGCKSNAFGADCQGRCTKTSAGRQCRGMLLCGAGGACDCAPGFGGPRCAEECESGRYGAGCRRACGRCEDGDDCDIYTGYCQRGCDGALQPPLCFEECGRLRAANALITCGADATPEDFPWHAGIYDTEYRNTNNPGDSATIEQICGATLIKPKLLISAAHCFYSEERQKVVEAKRYKVALGKKFRGWNDIEQPPDRVQRRDVALLYIPNRYRGMRLKFSDDIALVELDKGVVTTIYVAPVCIDWTGGFDKILDQTSKGAIVGWGKTEYNEPSPVLKLAVLPYVPSDQCFDKVSPTFWQYLDKDKFCAGDFNGAAVNNGDSGGGMVFQQHNSWYIRGIVSVGPPANLSLTAYTNVSSYRVWLSDLRNTVDLRQATIQSYGFD